VDSTSTPAQPPRRCVRQIRQAKKKGAGAKASPCVRCVNIAYRLF